MADVLCPTCGRPNSEHREFCDLCGNPLDSALPAEPQGSQLRNGLSSETDPEAIDEASRLDSFFEDTGPTPASPGGGQGEDIDRLDDYLSPEQPEADASSRLEDYFSPDPSGDQPGTDAGDVTRQPADASSRLDDYISPKDPDPIEQEDLPDSRSQDDISRLDDFFTSDPFRSPDPFQEPDFPDFGEEKFEDEFDPFKLPPAELNLTDELREKPAADTPESPSLDSWDLFSEEPGFDEDAESAAGTPGSESTSEFDFLDPGSAPEDERAPTESEQPAAEDWDFTDFRSALEKPPEGRQAVESPGSESPSEFDFLDPGSAPEDDQPPAESQQPAAEDWDLPDFQSALEEPPEGSQAAESPGSESPSEFDFLDPGSAPEDDQPPAADEEGEIDQWDFPEISSASDGPPPGAEEREAPVAETSPGEWEFLDPEPGGQAPSGAEEEQAVGSPKTSGGEFDFLDPDRVEEPSPGEPADQRPGGEFDFLDPGPADDATADLSDPAQPAAEEAAGGEFDWLDPGPAPDSGEMAAEMATGELEEDSGWLDMLQSPEDREPPPRIGAEPDKPQTDWLEKIKRLNKSSDLVDEDSSFPDWLAVSDKPAPEPEATPPEEESPSSEVPDWLKLDDDESLNEFLRRKDLTNEEYTPRITEVPSQETAEEDDAPADSLSDSQQIKFPSWADKEEKAKQALAAKQDTAREGPGAEPFQVEEEYFDDLFSEELPAWLTAAASSELSPTSEVELTQGELPGWVEAMRPVVESSDATGLADDEEYIENYGPLAGIPSVLPAEAEIGIDLEGGGKKPLDLLASSSHQEYVNLLKRIIGDENKGKTIRKPAPLATQRVLRWLISIVLLVTTAGTIIFGPDVDTSPLSPAQTRGTGFAAMYEQIDTLFAGQPVLIAYDYQPAAAGELHTAAAAVVDHLMEQGAFLTFVSTQPTGPALAEHFLDSTQAEHGYVHTQKYINLGYLPGESAGLLSFLIAPKQIIPLAFDGSNAWDSPPLLGVDSINDFRMILVITDDPNIAKIWLEQIGTHLDNTPLTMVVSAQVEPLVQPYFRSSPQLLNGYVAGLIDSMNYEQLTGQPNQASKIWLPFNVGIVISVVIIFISGLANGVLSLFTRRKTELLGEEK